MKTGLVLEGGAVRTIYSTGVLDYFNEQGLIFDYVVGVSAGIAFGINYLSNQPGRNLRVLLKYGGDPRYTGIHHMFNPKNKSFFNLDFVYAETAKLDPFDFEAYENYPGKVETGLTDLATGQVHYYEPDRKDQSFYLMRATCALPILFPIFHYDGKEVMDGGCVDAIPWKRALEMGCDRVVVVSTREDSYQRGAEKFMPLIRCAFRKYPEFLKVLETRADRYNQNREELFQAEKEGKVFLYRPKDTKGFSRTEKDQEKIKALYQNGYDDSKNRWDELMAYLSEK